MNKNMAHSFLFIRNFNQWRKPFFGFRDLLCACLNLHLVNVFTTIIREKRPFVHAVSLPAIVKVIVACCASVKIWMLGKNKHTLPAPPLAARRADKALYLPD